jgi:tripartite-type tricarboxylate transporter receptor subunit TctC
MKTLKITGLAVMAGVLGIALGETAAFGQSVEEFYKGKRIKIVSSSEPGGGYDTYARTVARHIGRHIPGNPKLLVQNMPGAGGVVAANWLYVVGPQDGTVIGSVQRAVPFVPIFGKKGPKYDPVKFH